MKKFNGQKLKFLLLITKIFTISIVAFSFSCRGNNEEPSPGNEETSIHFNDMGSMNDTKPLDNSSLIPKYKNDTEITLIDGSPDWMKSLIMLEVRIETATEEGAFRSAIPVLDHCAEMGVNGIWINPIYKRGGDEANGRNNGYGNWGPDTFEPKLTGTQSTEESYEVIKAFVDEAHKRNIRVIFDIIVWGTTKDSPLVTNHPEYYLKNADGSMKEVWGGYAWDWNNQGLRSYYKNAVINFVMKTGADGFRVDLAPDTSGYFFKEIKDACLANGRKIMVMSEICSQHLGAFDIDQSSVGWGPEPYHWENSDLLAKQKEKYGHHGDAFINNNIVDCIKTGYLIGQWQMQAEHIGGTLRYYTFNLLNHDDPTPNIKGNRVKFAYQAIFSPFIPIWWIGEEWINPGNKLYPGVMYFSKIEWNLLDVAQNRDFYEDVKKYIRIRRENTDIFEYFPSQLNNTNIQKVKSTVKGVENSLQSYARYIKNKAIIIIPNNQAKELTYTVTPDYDKIGLSGAKSYKITNLYNGEAFETSSSQLVHFDVTLRPYNVGIYKIETIQ